MSRTQKIFKYLLYLTFTFLLFTGKIYANDNPDSIKKQIAGNTSAFQTTSASSSGSIDSTANPNTSASPDIQMSSGAASLGVPIVLPPGINGLKPSLALGYSSSSKHGIVGYGWNLSINSIKRQTKFGLNYGSDIFEINGETLISTKGQNNWTHTKEKESDFAQYYYDDVTGWSVIRKNGTTYYYGSDDNSKTASVVHGTYEWFLKQVVDANGNTITYTYKTISDHVKLLEKITYNNNSVELYYEDNDNHTFSYRTFSRLNNHYRLKSIVVKTSYGSEYVRAYKLNYTNNVPYTSPDEPFMSLLDNIETFGSNINVDSKGEISEGNDSDFTNPYKEPVKRFYYQDTNFSDFTIDSVSIPNFASLKDSYDGFSKGDFNGDGKTDFFFWITRDKSDGEGNNVTYLSSTSDDYTIINSNSDNDSIDESLIGDCNVLITADFNDDGMTDLFFWKKSSGKNRLFYSNGDGYFHDKGEPIDHDLIDDYNDITSQGIIIKLANAHVGDYNNDGKNDLFFIRGSDGQNRYFLSNGSGGFTEKDKPYHEKSKIDEYSHVIPADFDGDGFTDVLCYRKSDGHSRLFSNNQNNTLTLNNKPINDWYFENFNDPLVGDFNGDGKIDLLFCKADGSVNTMFFYNNNFTFYAKNITLNQISSKTQVADINKDGYADLVNYNSVQFGYGNGKFSSASSASSVSGNLILSDINGDGRTDFLYLNEDSNTTQLYCTDTNYFPNLMSYYKYGYDLTTTTYEYDVSSNCENNKLPYVVDVVSSITKEDYMGDSFKTSYTYSGGNYSKEDREFLGFRVVTKTLPNDSMVDTIYYQDKYRNGKPLFIEYKTPDDDPYFRKSFDWKSHTIKSREVGYNPLVFAYLQSVTETKFEDNSSYSSLTSNYVYNLENGSITSKTVTGDFTNENGGTDSLISTYQYTYCGGTLTYPLKLKQMTLSNSEPKELKKSLFEYDSIGNLMKQTKSDLDNNKDQISHFTYHHNGNLSTTTDPEGNVTTISYDSTDTYPETIYSPTTENGFNHSRTMNEYDYRIGSPQHIFDENNNKITQTYDSLSRLKNVKYPDAGNIYYFYTFYKSGDLFESVSTYQADGTGKQIETTTIYNGFGKPIFVQNHGINESGFKARKNICYAYDEMGRLEYEIGPYYYSMLYPTNIRNKHYGVVYNYTDYPWKKYSYDLLGRITKIEQSGDIVTKFDYNKNSITTTDPDQNKTTKFTDALGRIIEIVEGVSLEEEHRTYYKYDLLGNLLKVTRNNPEDSQPINTIITYNSFGQKIRLIDPDMGTWTYEYDLNGNLAKQDGSLNVTIFKYDELNRLIEKDYDSTSINPDIKYTYDSSTNGIGAPHQEFIYNNSSYHAVTTYDSYDNMGRVTKLTKDIPGATYPIEKEFGYDITGKVKNIKYIKGGSGSPFKQVYYDYYPGSNFIKSVGDDSNPYVTLTGYELNNSIKKAVFNNGVETEYGYDTDTLRLNQIFTTNGTSDLINKEYKYSYAGDITQIDDHVNGDISNTYTYDHLHRLKSENQLNAGDASGAEIQEFSYGKFPDEPAHAVNKIVKNLTETIDFSYNANGNIEKSVSDENTREVSYNPENMPVSVSLNNSTTDYKYDSNGTRISKEGEENVYYFGNDLEERDGFYTLYIFAGNLRIAELKFTNGLDKNPTIKYYHKDHLGSTLAFTNSDGTIVESGGEGYLPFGKDRSDNNLAGGYKFTDQEEDTSTGLYNYDARLYDPGLGQFVMADTIVPGGGFDPQMLNRYAYCRNNPLIYTDPTGHMYDSTGYSPYSSPSSSERDDYEDGHDTSLSAGEVGGSHSDHDNDTLKDGESRSSQWVGNNFFKDTTIAEDGWFGWGTRTNTRVDWFNSINYKHGKVTRYGSDAGKLRDIYHAMTGHISEGLYDTYYSSSLRSGVWDATKMSGGIWVAAHVYTTAHALYVFDMFTGGSLSGPALNATGNFIRGGGAAAGFETLEFGGGLFLVGPPTSVTAAIGILSDLAIDAYYNDGGKYY